MKIDEVFSELSEEAQKDLYLRLKAKFESIPYNIPIIKYPYKVRLMNICGLIATVEGELK